MHMSFEMCGDNKLTIFFHSIFLEGEALDDTAISEELLDDNDDLLDVSFFF